MWLGRGDCLVMHIQRIKLIRPITNIETDKALKTIHEDSALGCDGMNSKFFNEVWHLIRFDMYHVVH